MLKKSVSYTDFNDEQQTETLYFNLTKSELADIIDITGKLTEIENMLEGESRTMQPHEIKKILDLVKLIIRLSYGVRSEDGKRFIKNDQVWEEFTQTAVYDEFLMSLFEDESASFDFLMAVIPKDLRSQVTGLAPEKRPTQLAKAPILTEPSDKAPVDDGVTLTINDFSREELVSMPKAQFDELAGTDPQKMSKDVLVIAMQRKGL